MCLGLAAIAAWAAADRGSSPDPLAAAYSATDLGNGKQLPTVVARVGSTDITAKWFAETVALGRLNNAEHGLGQTESEIERGAMDRLIGQAAMADRATSEGITVPDAAVRYQIRVQAVERNVLLVHNAAARDAFQSLLTSLHLTDGAAYDASPQTFQAVRAAMIVDALIAKHVGAHASQAARNAYVQSVIASEHVQLFISL